MRLVVPAAGRGMRLAGSDNPLPKLLIPILGRPLISHLLRMASATGLFSEVVIILGPWFETVAETIQDLASHIKWQSATEILCIENPKFELTNNVYSLYLARDYLEGEVVVHNSDVLVAPPLLTRLGSGIQGKARVLVERMSPVPEGETKVVVDSVDQVTDIAEAIESDKPSGRYVGVSAFDSSACEVFRDAVVSLVEHEEVGVFYTKALRMLAMRRPLNAVWTAGLPWFEIDTIEDLRAIGPSAREIVQQIKVPTTGRFCQVRSAKENRT